MGKCFLCIPPRELPDIDMLAHLRDEHDVSDSDFERWPDGAPVVLSDPDDGDGVDPRWLG